MTSTKTEFNKVLVNETFHTGIHKGAGINSFNTMCLLYKKTSKSKAKVIEQIGYSNNRMVGSPMTFSPFKNVFVIS
jgi:hypothetical protein